MKRMILLLVIAAAALALAQEKSIITVRDSSATTGVVIVDIQVAGKAAELQCNQGTPSCKALKPGNYAMVVLPKNRGLYDCKNAEVFAESANPDTDEKIGAYCLIQR